MMWSLNLKNEPFLLALPAVALLQRPPGRDRERTAHHAAQASPQKINKKVPGSHMAHFPYTLATPPFFGRCSQYSSALSLQPFVPFVCNNINSQQTEMRETRERPPDRALKPVHDKAPNHGEGSEWLNS